MVARIGDVEAGAAVRPREIYLAKAVDDGEEEDLGIILDDPEEVVIEADSSEAETVGDDTGEMDPVDSGEASDEEGGGIETPAADATDEVDAPAPAETPPEKSPAPTVPTPPAAATPAKPSRFFGSVGALIGTYHSLSGEPLERGAAGGVARLQWLPSEREGWSYTVGGFFKGGHGNMLGGGLNGGIEVASERSVFSLAADAGWLRLYGPDDDADLALKPVGVDTNRHVVNAVIVPVNVVTDSGFLALRPEFGIRIFERTFFYGAAGAGLFFGKLTDKECRIVAIDRSNPSITNASRCRDKRSVLGWTQELEVGLKREF